MYEHTRVSMLALTMLVSVAVTVGQYCTPPCRPGYTCVNGECVSVCNPPCPLEFRCDPATLDCVPIERPVAAAPQSRRELTCSDNGDCPSRRLCIDGRCRSAEDVVTVGREDYVVTVPFFALGCLYSALVPLCASYAAGRNTVVGLGAGQSLMYMLYGGLMQRPKGMQASYLRALGVRPPGGLIAAGWILYGLSIGTIWSHFSSYRSHDEGLEQTMAAVNAAVLLSSFSVSMAEYAWQAKLLRKAVGSDARAGYGQSRVRVTPYVGASRDRSVAGLGIDY